MWSRVKVTYQAHNLEIGGSSPPSATIKNRSEYMNLSSYNQMAEVGILIYLFLGYGRKFTITNQNFQQKYLDQLTFYKSLKMLLSTSG